MPLERRSGGGIGLAAVRPPVDVLVIDDDPVASELAMAMLTRLGHAARTAGDGVLALAECRRSPPRAVLIDLQMPNMDGLAATRELRRLQAQGDLPPFPIIVVSGHYAQEDRAACVDAGADGFIAKPLMLAKLGAELARVLRPPPDAARPLRRRPATPSGGGLA